VVRGFCQVGEWWGTVVGASELDAFCFRKVFRWVFFVGEMCLVFFFLLWVDCLGRRALWGVLAPVRGWVGTRHRACRVWFVFACFR